MTWSEMPAILSAVIGCGMEKYEEWMRRCVDLARLAASRDEVPVGALVVRDGVVISEAFNLREERQSPSGHAELMAIEEACRKLASWRLVDCVLVTSLEPCVMCAGALIQARIGTLVYGALDPKGGAESVFGLLSSERHHHRVQVVSGVLESECSMVLKDFFKNKRN